MMRLPGIAPAMLDHIEEQWLHGRPERTCDLSAAILKGPVGGLLSSQTNRKTHRGSTAFRVIAMLHEFPETKGR